MFLRRFLLLADHASTSAARLGDIVFVNLSLPFRQWSCFEPSVHLCLLVLSLFFYLKGLWLDPDCCACIRP